MKHALRFGVPMIPHALAGWVMGMSDRMMINRLQSVSEMGLYTVAAQLAGVLGMLQLSFNTAWSPWLYAELKREDAQVNRKIVRFTYAYVGAMLVIGWTVSWLAPWGIQFLVGKGLFFGWRWLERLSRFITRALGI
jgi:O-antigen/teichoic acid export membrane protein